MTITSIGAVRKPDGGNPRGPKRDCFRITGHRTLSILPRERCNHRFMADEYAHRVECLRSFTRCFWWADDGKFVSTTGSGSLPSPLSYAEWKVENESRRVEAERKADLAALAFRIEAEVEDDDAIAAVFF